MSKIRRIPVSMIENPTTGANLASELESNSQNINELIDKSANELHIDQFIEDDNVVDYTSILQTAINEAQASKKQLKLKPGKSYTITAPLLITAGCSIVSDAQNRAIIRTSTQTFDPIQVNGSLVTSTTLASSATVNTKWINVTDASGISPGNIIELMSSKSWYHDPRPESSDCRKAELHRVDEVIGNKIYLTDPLMDGYDLTKESVTITAYVPIRFHMANIEVVLTKHPVATDSERQTGISLSHTIDSLLDNVYVSGAQNCGIFLKHSYRPKVLGGRTEGANNYFSGYGVQTYGTTHALIKDRHFRNCRRGVDISGGKIPSHYSVIENCSVFGNGLNSLHDRYVRNDDHTTGAVAQGFGTHGGADHTIFRNNYMGFLEIGIMNRSRNTIIENNYFVGDIGDACIDNAYGENLTVLNNKAYDGFLGMKENGIFDGGANRNTRKPPAFIRLQYSYLENGKKGGYTHIEGNFAIVQSKFITLYGNSVSPTSMVAQENWVIKDNHCFFTPQNTVDHVYFIKNDMPLVTTMMIEKSTEKNNTFRNLTGTGSFSKYSGVDMRRDVEFNEPKAFGWFMANDTVESIDFGIGDTFSYVNILVNANGAYGLVRMANNSTLFTALGTTGSLAGTNVVLTGTTGSVNFLTLSIVDGRLYVENRLGSSNRVMLTIMNYT